MDQKPLLPRTISEYEELSSGKKVKTIRTISATARHTLFILCATLWILAFLWWSGALRFSEDPVDQIDPWEAYGPLAATLLILTRLVSFLAVPQTIFNLVGLFKFNPFPARKSPALKSSPLLAPFICVRVVTRGLYPKLVNETVRKNKETLSGIGFENFVIQVVTDTPLAIAAAALDPKRVHVLVVPSTYKTKTGALNKSRALQYCLEDDVNMLGDDDWIIHLDEETLLTEQSVKGILNFIVENKHPFGQGLITYASNRVHFKSPWQFLQHRICTVADSFRVADDMGKIRCQFKVFHKPIFGMKGSYVVTKVGAERKISFDNGPEGSKAEDAFFAMVAMDQGLTFDFIEGEMHEKSPFTFSDFFKQRKRWMQGIYMVVASSRISLRTKFLLGVSLASWLTLPLATANLVLTKAFPFSLGKAADLVLGWLGAMGLLAYGYGYIKQHQMRRYSFVRKLVAIPEIIVASLVSIVVENLAVCSMWFGDWYDFYIVQKETDCDEDLRVVDKV